MADTKLPGEVDDGVVAFRDLPSRKEYVVITDVPILDEHELTPDSDNEGEWIGPERLQEIANNNNKRIQETGDACPISIGHTKDGVKETEQPPVVGYATDFKVAPLLNAKRMAIYANFHILKDRLDEVKNYPRRSVELWPKRWEIDPIALLGATTPERDLGLLQLGRDGKPKRYRRTLNEGPEMAKEDMEDDVEDTGKPPKKTAKKSKPEDSDDGGELGAGEEKIAQRVLALLMESAPFKELMSAMQGGGQGGDDHGMGEPQDQPLMGGDPSGGQGGPGGLGDGHQEAAFYHQGSPERYEEGEEDEGCNYDEPQHYSGYASSTNTYMPGEHEMNGHRARGYTPYDGDGFYEDYHERPMRRQSARERYQRYLAEQEARRLEGSPIRKQAAATDKVVKTRREEDKVSRLEAQVRKLERDKTEAQRTATLRGLQAEGYVLEVAEEIGDCAEMSDEMFSNHIARIKKRYSRDPSGIGPIRMVDDAEPPIRRQRGAKPIDDAHLARDIGGYMAEHKCDFATASAAIKSKQNGRV